MTSASGPRRALLIGNSDGIGLALTRRLLADGFRVVSLSRRPCPVAAVDEHVVADVSAADYRERLRELCQRHGPIDACVWLVGIADDFEPATFASELDVVQTNFLAAVATMAVVVPPMVARGRGHFVGVSSLADGLLIADCPAYSASKAALTSYLTGCAPKLRERGVAVTNVRLGFVDTKMALAGVRPMMATPERAAGLLADCLRRRPTQLSWPKPMALCAHVARWLQRPGVWLTNARR